MFRNLVLCFAEKIEKIDKHPIWKIENIESWLNTNPALEEFPKKILVTDKLPNDTWHGWKWLKHDNQGHLDFNIGAPCNICL